MTDEIAIYRSRSRSGTQRWRWRCVCRRTGNVLFAATEGYGSEAEVRRRLRKLQDRGTINPNIPIAKGTP